MCMFLLLRVCWSERTHLKGQNNTVNSEIIVLLWTLGMRLMKRGLFFFFFQQHQCCNELLRNRVQGEGSHQWWPLGTFRTTDGGNSQVCVTQAYRTRARWAETPLCCSWQSGFYFSFKYICMCYSVFCVCLCRSTFMYEQFPEVMNMLWTRMLKDNKKNWRRVYKVLVQWGSWLCTQSCFFIQLIWFNLSTTQSSGISEYWKWMDGFNL